MRITTFNLRAAAVAENRLNMEYPRDEAVRFEARQSDFALTIDARSASIGVGSGGSAHVVDETRDGLRGGCGRVVGTAVFAQAPAAPPPGSAPPGEVVVGSGNYSPMVQDLDKALEFYVGLLGLTVPPPPAPGPRPVNTDPALLGMFGMPGAQLRFVTARIPGANVGVEIVEVGVSTRRRFVRVRRIPVARR